MGNKVLAIGKVGGLIATAERVILTTGGGVEITFGMGIGTGFGLGNALVIGSTLLPNQNRVSPPSTQFKSAPIPAQTSNQIPSIPTNWIEPGTSDNRAQTQQPSPEPIPSSTPRQSLAQPHPSRIEPSSGDNRSQPQQPSPTPTKIATQKIEIPIPQPSLKSPPPNTTLNQTTLAIPKPTKTVPKVDMSGGDDPPSDSDDFSAGMPVNKMPITNNSQTPNVPVDRSQASLDRSKIGSINNSSSSSRDIPGNSQRIASGNGGGNSKNPPRLSGENQSSSNVNPHGNGGEKDRQNSSLSENIATGSNRKLSIQCLRNCEIRYPENLEASDTGKDKILVKITIDANGLVINAEIDRSSGNHQLDLFALEKIKQMQLTAMGESKTFRIKINTLSGDR